MSKKSKTESGPSKWAQGYLTPAIGEINSVYDQNKGAIGDISKGIQGLIPGLTDRFNQGDENVNAARGYNSDVLGGKYLSGNPYLQQIIDQTNSSVGDSVNSMIGSRGATGGSAHAGILARELAKNESGLRYNDYNTQMGRMDGAAAMAPSFNASDNSNLAALLSTASAGSELPFEASNNLAQQLAALLGNSTTTTSKQPLLPSLLGAAGSALGGWASGGFR